MQSVNEVMIRLEADASQMKREVAGARGELTSNMEQMRRSSGGVEEGLKKAATAARAFAGAAGVGMVVAAMQRAVMAGAEFERVQGRIEAVLKATDGASGQTAQSIERIARALGEETLASTKEVREAAAQLMMFKSVSGDAFETTLRYAQDLAALGFGSLTSAAVELGKALENPEQGLGALRKVGVSFTAQQMQQIQGFMRTGEAAKVQAIIFGELEKRIGGAGKGEGKGLLGAIDTFNERLGVLWETMGRGPGVQRTAIVAINEFSAALERANMIAERKLPMDQWGEKTLQFEKEKLEQDIERLERAQKQNYRGVAGRRINEDLEASRARLRQVEEAMQRLRPTVEPPKPQVASWDNPIPLPPGMKAPIPGRNPGMAGIEAWEDKRDARREADEAAALAEAKARLSYAIDQVNKALAEGADIEKAYLDRQREGAALIEEMMTPLERRAALEAQYWELLRGGHIDLTTYNRAMDQAAKLTDATTSATERLAQAADELGWAFSSSFEDAILKGAKVSDMLKGLANDMARILLRSLVTKPLAGAVTGWLGGVFGGGRAEGGPVRPGVPYLVGEKRQAELFVPDVPGRIINDRDLRRMGGGGGAAAAAGPAAVYHIDARGADAARLSQLEQLLVRLDRSVEVRAVTAVGERQRRG